MDNSDRLVLQRLSGSAHLEVGIDKNGLLAMIGLFKESALMACCDWLCGIGLPVIGQAGA